MTFKHFISTIVDEIRLQTAVRKKSPRPWWTSECQWPPASSGFPRSRKRAAFEALKKFTKQIKFTN